MINENTFERLSLPITDISEEFILYALKQLRAISNKLIREENINERARLIQLQNKWEQYINDAEEWMDEELANSYRRGLEQGNIPTGATLTAGAFLSSGLLIPDNPSQPISDTAREILEDYPEHHTMYGVFRQKADNAYEATRLPILRQHQDRIRELTILASDSEFISGDTLTRRELSQSIMNRYANEGVTGIRYSDGRTMKLDTYSEMTARTLTMQASNQATWNRAQEYGNDLVQISQHFPCSDLCVDWQARVYSLSGSDVRFPPLDRAIAGGLYHPNCKHTSSPYVEGVNELPDEKLTKRRNAKQYEAQKMQRYNERQIRDWKRREATSLTDKERNKAKSKIKEWQARQREHIDSNPFLRRKYDRESV